MKIDFADVLIMAGAGLVIVAAFMLSLAHGLFLTGTLLLAVGVARGRRTL